VRRSRISCLLHEDWLRLPEVGTHCGIQRIEILVQSQRVEYFSALDYGLAYRGSEATALIAQSLRFRKTPAKCSVELTFML
jgi:hypothetical protein